MKHFFLTLTTSFLFLFCATPVFALDLYVATDGNNTNPGTITQPFKTIVRAQQRVREIIAAGLTQPVTVNLRGGTYELSSPIIYVPEDSGIEQFPISYTGYGNEQAIISGGKKLLGWTQVNNKWQTNIPAELPIPRQLWVKGGRANRAQETATGWERTATGFTLSTPRSFSHPEDIEVVYRSPYWYEHRCGVQSKQNNTILMEEPCWTNVNVREAQPFQASIIENAIEFLDQAGEWYADPRTRVITYIPKSGEVINETAIVMPVLENLINLRSAHDLIFSKLTFAYSTWNDPVDGPSSNLGFPEGQANSIIGPTRQPSSAIYNYKVNRIIYDHLKIIHVGGAGIDFGTGSKNSKLTSSIISDVSSNGATIGMTSLGWRDETNQLDEITISNNYITRAGVEYHGAVAILAWWAKNLHIENNTLYNLPYSGISFGWGHGKGDPTYAKDNMIKNNLLIDYMNVLYDGGGIYSMSAQPGSIVEGNVMLDQINEWGSIYADANTRFITYKNNVMFHESKRARSVIENGGSNYFYNNYWQVRDPATLEGRRKLPDLTFNQVPYSKCTEYGIPVDCGVSEHPTSGSQANHVITSLSQVPNSLLQRAGVTCPNRIPTLENALNLPYSRPSCTTNPADLNADSKVDILDYNILLSNFGKTGAVGWISSDIVKNGKVDLFDYNSLVTNYGK